MSVVVFLDGFLVMCLSGKCEWCFGGCEWLLVGVSGQTSACLFHGVWWILLAFKVDLMLFEVEFDGSAVVVDGF